MRLKVHMVDKAGETLCGQAKNMFGERTWDDVTCDECNSIYNNECDESRRIAIDNNHREWKEKAIRIFYDPTEGEAIPDAKAIDWVMGLKAGDYKIVSSAIVIDALALCIARGDINNQIVEVTYMKKDVLNGMYFSEYGNSMDWFTSVSEGILEEKIMLTAKKTREKRKFSVVHFVKENDLISTFRTCVDEYKRLFPGREVKKQIIEVGDERQLYFIVCLKDNEKREDFTSEINEWCNKVACLKVNLVTENYNKDKES